MTDVLLLEPDSVLAQTYQAALEHAGLNVAVAHEAQAAVQQLDEHMPAVIVAELQLGEHNGLEFLHEVRSYPDVADIPVIVYSRVPLNELGLTDTAKQDLHIKAYCYKPQTSLQELIETVKYHLEPHET